MGVIKQCETCWGTGCVEPDMDYCEDCDGSGYVEVENSQDGE